MSLYFGRGDPTERSNFGLKIEIFNFFPKIWSDMWEKFVNRSILFTEGKMEQILLAYGIPKETVNAIMMLYNNTRAKVLSPGSNTDFFDILAGVLQGDTLAPFIFIICLDYVLHTSVDKIKHLGLTLTKARSCRHPAVTITDADYADDLALMADTIADVQTLLHSLETASGDTDLCVNEKKTEYMSYSTMHTLSSDDIKSVSFFIYLGSNVASTES